MSDHVLIAFVGWTCSAVILIGMPLAIGYMRRMSRAPAAPMLGSGEALERLERMERSIDAIGVQVERIQEAQRFTAKLLASGSENRQTATPA